MKHLDRILIILIAVFALPLGFGCQDHDRLEAFLQSPRSPVSAAEYIVYPPDVISITSTRIAEINGVSLRVRPDGKITLPLLKDIVVAGKTPRQIEEAIIEVSKKYYRQGDATVQVTGYLSQKFYVFGQVRQPGPRPWTGRNTLLDVLASVQPTPHAWFEKIRVVRATEPQYGGYPPPADRDKKEFERHNGETGKTKAGADELIVDLNAMIKSGDLSRNILLQPNDIIHVQPHPIAAVGLALQELLFPTRPALEAVRLPYAMEYNLDSDRGYGERRQ